MDALRSLGMTAVVAAAVACSSDAPVANKPPAAAAVKPATPAPDAPKQATPVVEPAKEDCIEPVAAEAIASVVRTWELVGTSHARVFLGGIGDVVFVAAGAHLYDGEPGKALAHSTRRAVGLAKKPVVAVFGAWPEDAWLVTLRGAHAEDTGGQEFDLWRWQSDRWSRETKKALLGDGMAEVYRWTEGRVLALDCSARPRLAFESFGAVGELPPRLSRVGNASFCPEKFFALPAGDVFAIDDLSRANHMMIHWCPTCGDPAVEEILPLRLCGAPPTVSLGNIQVPIAPREAILSVHAQTPVKPGEDAFSGAFLVRREEGSWIGEAVPGGQSVDTIAVGTDGAIWLATDTLLRRAPQGKWERHGLPPGVTGDIAQVVAVRDDEVWIVVADPVKDTVKDATSWSVYRTGSAQGVALNLDRGTALAPAKPAR
ncbi:MAG: hypothetical protein H0T76_01850 [Nannocystis sp.]|nr:hypothetical protein [Nannocystis sp.]